MTDNLEKILKDFEQKIAEKTDEGYASRAVDELTGITCDMGYISDHHPRVSFDNEEVFRTLTENEGLLATVVEGDIDELIHIVVNTPIPFYIECPTCGEKFKDEASLTQLVEVIEGYRAIQDIVPKMSPANREILRPRGDYCGKCWEKMFGRGE